MLYQAASNSLNQKCHDSLFSDTEVYKHVLPCTVYQSFLRYQKVKQTTIWLHTVQRKTSSYHLVAQSFMSYMLLYCVCVYKSVHCLSGPKNVKPSFTVALPRMPYLVVPPQRALLLTTCLQTVNFAHQVSSGKHLMKRNSSSVTFSK